MGMTTSSWIVPESESLNTLAENRTTLRNHEPVDKDKQFTNI